MAGKPIKKKSIIQTAKLIAPTTALIVEKTTTGNATARRAAQILVEKQAGFALPTPKQKKNIVVAFVKRDMIVYGLLLTLLSFLLLSISMI